ncbi:hypothetical protein SERLA73DRAFT_74481 [Serpula lacrymans var. lacrymans S7.3]|uniref:Uncharacterized protein n=1 Tax=Serpula lacrymans var. lacrymans (strain S7.3) TaxID=936435 RepID=F8PZD3_SERL3|nr:hypothetical protein SERLA73DRAFT_74481 [Serpula lacrymans var. lacrymans S7.3]
MAKELASQGIVCVNWPHGVLLPGEEQSSTAKPKSISDLTLSERSKLFAPRPSTITLQICAKVTMGTRKGKDQGHPSQAAHQDGTFDEDEPPAEPPARTGAKGGKKVEVVKVVPPQSKLLKSKSDPDTGYEDTLPAQKRKISAKASKHLAKQDAHSTHLQQENTTNKPQKAKKALATVKESQKSSHTESLPTTKGQSTSLMVGQSLPLTEPSSVNKSQKDAGVALHNECGEQLNPTLHKAGGVSKEGSVDLDKMFNLHYLTYKTLAAHANIPEPHDAMQPTTSAPPFISVASASLPSSTAEHPLVQHSSMPARLAGIEEGYPSVTPGNGRLTVQDVPTEDLYCVPGEGALHGEQVDGHYATSREQDNITALAGASQEPPPLLWTTWVIADNILWTAMLALVVALREGPLCDGQGPLHYSVEQVNTAAGKGTLQEPPLPLNNYTSSGRAEDLYCAPGEGACCVEDGASHYWEQVNVTAVRGSSQEPPPPVNNYVGHCGQDFVENHGGGAIASHRLSEGQYTDYRPSSSAMGGCIRDNGMSLAPWRKIHAMQDLTKDMVK